MMAQNNPNPKARMARRQGIPPNPVQRNNHKGSKTLYGSIRRRRHRSGIHPIRRRDKHIRGIGGIGVDQGGRLK